MSRISRTAPRGVTLALTLALGSPALFAGPDAPAAAPASPATAPATQESPPADADAAPAGRAGGAISLAAPFESLSGGIALRPPADCKPLREAGKDEIVQFRNEAGWNLVVSRKSYLKPTALTTAPDRFGQPRPGLLQEAVAAIQGTYPGCQILRQNLTNLGNNDVGMIVFRYTNNAKRRLAQSAIIQANDQLYYIVALSTPGRNVDDDKVEDPGERSAVETFRAVLDSVKLLDREKIREDQVDRLVRTRTFLFDLNEHKLMATLLPQQWRRIKRDGRDIGYQYIVEAPDRKGGQRGIYVGIRTRVMSGGVQKPFPREESSANLFTSFNRQHEDWSKLTALDDGTPKDRDHPWQYVTEFGTADLRTSRHFAGDKNQFKVGEIGDPQQPWVDVKQMYELDVQYVGNHGDLDPLQRPLPPFYLPQSLGTMLPRLLPVNEAKTYLFAAYVSDAHEVMLRYVEVGHDQEVQIEPGGPKFHAVPVTEHLGWEGSVTTHYVDSRGTWLGSVNKDSKVTILPTDEKTLTDLWKDADLSRPGDLGKAPAAPAARSSDPLTSGRLRGPGQPAANNDEEPGRVLPLPRQIGPDAPERPAPPRGGPPLINPARPGK